MPRSVKFTNLTRETRLWRFGLRILIFYLRKRPRNLEFICSQRLRLIRKEAELLLNPLGRSRNASPKESHLNTIRGSSPRLKPQDRRKTPVFWRKSRENGNLYRFLQGLLGIFNGDGLSFGKALFQIK